MCDFNGIPFVFQKYLKEVSPFWCSWVQMWWLLIWNIVQIMVSFDNSSVQCFIFLKWCDIIIILRRWIILYSFWEECKVHLSQGWIKQSTIWSSKCALLNGQGFRFNVFMIPINLHLECHLMVASSPIHCWNVEFCCGIGGIMAFVRVCSCFVVQ